MTCCSASASSTRACSALGERRQLSLGLVVGAVVAALRVDPGEAVEDGARDAGPQAEATGLQLHGRRLQRLGGHLRGQGALPDEPVEAQLLVLEVPLQGVGVAAEARGPDGLVGFLGALRAVAIAPAPLHGVGGTEALADDLVGFVLGGRGDVHRVGAHVRDEARGLAVDGDALVEPLRHRHRASGPEAQLAAGLLLQRAGREGWRRIALAGPHGSRAHRGGLAAQAPPRRPGRWRRSAMGTSLRPTSPPRATLVPSTRVRLALNGSSRADRRSASRVQYSRGVKASMMAFALHHEAHRHRLDASRGEPAADLARDERAERVAHEAVHDAARLLGVHEVHVDVARVGEGRVDGALGDLAEGHPTALVVGDVHGLHDVPGDGLPLPVEVRGEIHQVRGGGGPADGGELLAAVLADDVLGREVVLDVHAQLALAGVLRQVPNVAVGGQDPVAVTKVPLDRPRLGGRLDDHEVPGHGRRV